MHEEREHISAGPRLVAAVYGLLAVAAVAAAVLVPTQLEVPEVGPILVFGLMIVWAENGGVNLPSDTAISPSFMIVMASIAAFRGDGTVLGACVVGLAAGLVFELIRKRRFATAIANAAQYLLAAGAAALAYDEVRPANTLLAIVVAGVAFATVNVGLVLPGQVVGTKASPGEVWADMRPALPNYLAFGLLGTLLGELYSSMGPLAVLLVMTPVAIARAAFASVVELAHAQESTIKVFLRAIAAKDDYTARHTERVCRYSLYIGEQLGFSHTRLQHLRQSALMHDIGKLAVPKHLLNKPGKLSDEEFVRVQQHAHVCIDILSVVDFLEPMIAAAAGHHARYDGGGYGGTGERPIEAYIVAVADAYDAMTSTRAYRRALPMEVAFDELRAKSGSQFHPDCVEGLIKAIEERGERHGLGFETDVVDYAVAPPVAGVGSAGLGDREPAPLPGP